MISRQVVFLQGIWGKDLSNSETAFGLVEIAMSCYTGIAFFLEALWWAEGEKERVYTKQHGCFHGLPKRKIPTNIAFFPKNLSALRYFC